MRDEALNLLEIDPDDRILDVGSGTGFATQALQEQSQNVYALDQSRGQMNRAWNKLDKHGPVEFTFGDAEQLPYGPDTFDIVWSSGSIEYWPHPVAALEEIRRVLRPGGQVLIVGPHRPQTRIGQWMADQIMLFYSQEEADRMFTTAGFEAIEHTLMGPVYKPDIAIVTTARAPS